MSLTHIGSLRKPPKVRSRSLVILDRRAKQQAARLSDEAGYSSDDGRGDGDAFYASRPDTPRSKSKITYMRPTTRASLSSIHNKDLHCSESLTELLRKRAQKAPPQPPAQPAQNTSNPLDDFVDWVISSFNQIRPHLFDVLLVCVFLLLSIATVSVWRYKQRHVIEPQNTRYILCDDDLSARAREQAVEKGECIEQAHLEHGLRIVREVKKLLHAKMKHRLCSTDSDETDAIGYRELSDELRKKFDDFRYKNLHNELLAAKHLIMQNPRWDIAVQGVAAMALTGNGDRYGVTMMEEPPVLRWQCSITKKFRRFFYIVGIIVPISLVGALIYAAVRYYLYRQKLKEMKITEYTEAIIKELQERAEQPDKQHTIVNHLREELLPLQDRSKHLWAWNEAVKLLEANDSRIICGLTVLNGEEYKTMQWNSNDETSEEADECVEYLSKWRLVERSTSLPECRSNCLKITELFNQHHLKEPDLQMQMYKAISYKVGKECNIEEFGINDRKFAIYMRCKTTKDAELAYKALCGWSYNNHLLGIRFIAYNPEHYMEWEGQM